MIMARRRIDDAKKKAVAEAKKAEAAKKKPQAPVKPKDTK